MTRDLRDALRSDRTPQHHRARLDEVVRAEWRILLAVALIIALGTVAGLIA